MRMMPCSYSSTSSRNGERVMEVVIQVRAGADHEIDQAALHQLDDAAAEARGRHGARDGEPDRRVALGREHLVGKDVARFRQPSGIEGLEAAVDQFPNLDAPPGPVIANRLALQILTGPMVRGSGRAPLDVARGALSASRRAMRHTGENSRRMPNDECGMPNAKCQMLNAKCQMLNGKPTEDISGSSRHNESM